MKTACTSPLPQGSVVKIGRRTGVEMWKQDVLHNRRLSPPAVVGALVAVADLKGIVHFLDAATGAAGRARQDQR